MRSRQLRNSSTSVTCRRHLTPGTKDIPMRCSQSLTDPDLRLEHPTAEASRGTCSIALRSSRNRSCLPVTKDRLTRFAYFRTVVDWPAWEKMALYEFGTLRLK